MATDTVDPGLVELRGLSKTFGSVRAVDDLSVTVPPGRVTGFLGPNGAGKTTTLRMLLGLVTPTAGTATVGGRRYADLEAPQRTVGALLEASDVHPGRTGRDHLRVLAVTAGVPDSRVDALLALVGLTDSADRRAGGYSLGMRQRLGLAAALLGDPPVLVLDEPANGLDPEGIAWLRGFLRALAAEGRTVLISSHVLAEVQQTVDDVVIIARGRLVQHSSLADLAETARRTVRVVSPDADRLAGVLTGAGASATTVDGAPGSLRVQGMTAAEVGHAAHRTGVELHELRAEDEGLEQTFLRLTAHEGVAP